MHSRVAACLVFIAGCGLLAIPAHPAAQGNQAHRAIVAFAPEQTSRTLSTGFLPWHRQRSQLHTAGKTLQPPTFHVLPGIEVRVSRRIDEGRLSVHVWNSLGKRLDKLISGEAERQQT